jgi:3-deoxy-D-arabino-heptulosonate 7-phosphate (DAHP) synthase class II
MPRMKKLGSQANPVRSSSWDGWEHWADNEILPMVPQILEKTPDTVVPQAVFWLFKILESVTAESGFLYESGSFRVQGKKSISEAIR